MIVQSAFTIPFSIFVIVIVVEIQQFSTLLFSSVFVVVVVHIELSMDLYVYIFFKCLIQTKKNAVINALAHIYVHALSSTHCNYLDECQNMNRFI